MWSAFVLIAMTTVTGFYVMFGQQQAGYADQATAAALADSMATYRAAVVTYFRQHPGQTQSVDMATLQASGALPQWSTIASKPQQAPWANYRGADGMIYIYAASRPATNIAADLAAQSHNSILAGVYRRGDTTLHSPVYGDTGVPLPAAAVNTIPDGSPVWIANSQ